MKIYLTFALGFLLIASSCQKQDILKNNHLKIHFTELGVQSISSLSGKNSLALDSDQFLLVINTDTIRSEELRPDKIRTQTNQRIIDYTVNGFLLQVVYELKPGWEFLSKQILISNTKQTNFKLEQCIPWIAEFSEKPDQVLDLTAGKYGKLIRYEGAQTGSFYLVQNPYTTYALNGKKMDGEYPAKMNWDGTDGAYATDRACIGLYGLSGTTLRHDLLPEWKYVPDPDQYIQEGIQLDYAEIEAVSNCARAFLLVDPKKATKVHIGWCENDYQIDMATPDGRTEYIRILDQAAAVGCENVLYTPNHSVYGPLENNRDAWGWESVLWLGLGQKVRTGEWVAGRDAIPADIQEMLDYAKSKGVKLMAYVYPSMPFMQDSAWTAWRTSIGQKPENYLTVDTGLKSYQDWFVDQCIAFYEQTGISGYSFDHWWIAYEDEHGLVSSKYQQWYGTRRILEELRRRAPEIIIDGRQQYHHFGTWTWLAGTYPHPMMSDEQPGSFNPFPDLSTDRISADRQRYVAHRLMVRDFIPIEILPGFITHQTQRSDANRVMRRDTYRTRDWDYMGWKYSIISTIATAPFNLVINYLPARDPEEFEHFKKEDQEFFKKWLDFADENLDVLKNLRPILGQPMVGRCDGTAAILDDQGYVFVFNPNYKKLSASFMMDQSIGLTQGDRFMIQEVYPDARNIGHPETGFFTYGDPVELQMEGTSARVLKITPVQKLPTDPVLFNYSGKAVTEGDKLIITEIEGCVGSSGTLLVFHPDTKKILSVEINGLQVNFEKSGDLLTCQLLFGGAFFETDHQIGGYDSATGSGPYAWKLTLPKRIKDQLVARKKQWPVSYTEDDLVASWTDPSRLLLFINIADPFRDKEPLQPEEIHLLIDGSPRKVVSANNGVYPYAKRTFFGFYVDLSDLEAEKEYSIELSLPDDLAPGQFQGLFLGNLENEKTSILKN